MKSREVRLVRRPEGLPSENDFEIVEVALRPPADGEVLVRNVWMSVDPYMRGRMFDRKSYVPPFRVGAPLEGGCVGRVIASRHPGFAVGDVVSGMLGWREAYLSDGTGLTRIDPSGVPLQTYLGVLGIPGLTAYVGLLEIASIKAGETVYVSAAAGAVGLVACQIARIKGCRVVGSAGSAEKVAWLRETARLDAAFDYRACPDLRAELARACPNGIDVYFDNVGGEQLEAALAAMNTFGRVVLCGAIAQYNQASPPPGPSTLVMAIPKRLTLRGFIVTDHLGTFPAFLADMRRWITEGRMVWQETVLEGIESAPRAFLGLFSGANAGKMLVRLAPDETE